jgi:hypothetical protein
MVYFLALAGMTKKAFKTGAFNRSAIPPSSMLPDSSVLRRFSAAPDIKTLFTCS